MAKLCGKYGKDIPIIKIETKTIVEFDTKKMTQKLKTAINKGWIICGFYGKTVHLERIK